MKVATLADVFSANRKEVKESAMVRILFDITLDWSCQQKPPSGDWKVWRSFLLGYSKARGSALLPIQMMDWSSTHLRWRWIGSKHGVLDTHTGKTYRVVSEIRAGRVCKMGLIHQGKNMMPVEVRRAESFAVICGQHPKNQGVLDKRFW